MATFSHLPSGKWRAQVRRAPGCTATPLSRRSATLKLGRPASKTQAHHIAASGFAPIPKGATIEMLIDKYVETFA